MVRDVTKPRALETEKRGLLSQEEQQGFPEEVVFECRLEQEGAKFRLTCAGVAWGPVASI